MVPLYQAAGSRYLCGPFFSTWGRHGFDSGFVMCVSMPGVMCGPYPSASSP